MSIAEPRQRVDAAAYLAWESDQHERHEFVNGEIHAMEGARDAHNRVAGNLCIALRKALDGTPCRIFMSEMKLHIVQANAYLYPDVFVTCHEADRRPEADCMKRHPNLVVEVLSKTSAGRDRGRKFALYRGIEGLGEVMFVDPDHPQVDLFRRNPADGLWVLHPAIGLDARVSLQGLDIELALADLYRDVIGRPEPRSAG